MTAKEYLNIALGGNMNIKTLTPLAFEEIMEQYAKEKEKEAFERFWNLLGVEPKCKTFGEIFTEFNDEFKKQSK